MSRLLQHSTSLCTAILLVVFALPTTSHSKSIKQASDTSEATSVVIEDFTPKGAFSGDNIRVTGRGLDTPKLRFKLGKKTLKIVEKSNTHAVVKLPKKVKSGAIIAILKKNKVSAPEQLAIFQIPKLATVPRFMAKRSRVIIKGRNLDGVERWKLGDTFLADDKTYKKRSKKRVQLIVPLDAVSGHRLEAIVNEKEFPSKHPIAVGEAPAIYSVAYWPENHPKKKQLGMIHGDRFKSDIVVKIANRKAKILKIEPNQIAFELKRPGPKKKFQVTASNGPFSSESFTVDGAAEGFILARKKLDKMLFREPPTLHIFQIEMELELIENRLLQNVRRGRSKSIESDKLRGETTMQLMEAMKRIRIIQASICAAMGPKNGDQKGNSILGNRLKEVTKALEQLAEEALLELWSDIPESSLSGRASKKLKMDSAAKALNLVVEARDLPEITCRGRYFKDHNGKIVESTALVKKDLERPFRHAMVTAFTPLVASVKSKPVLEKKLKKIFAGVVPSKTRAFWIGLITDQYDKITSEQIQSNTGNAQTFEAIVAQKNKAAGPLNVAVLWVTDSEVFIQNIDGKVSKNKIRFSPENNVPKALNDLDKRNSIGYIVAYSDKDKSGGLTRSGKKLMEWSEVAALASENVLVHSSNTLPKDQRVYPRINGTIQKGVNLIDVELLAKCKDGRCNGYDKGSVVKTAKSISLKSVDTPGVRVPNLE